MDLHQRIANKVVALEELIDIYQKTGVVWNVYEVPSISKVIMESYPNLHIIPREYPSTAEAFLADATTRLEDDGLIHFILFPELLNADPLEKENADELAAHIASNTSPNTYVLYGLTVIGDDYNYVHGYLIDREIGKIESWRKHGETYGSQQANWKPYPKHFDVIPRIETPNMEINVRMCAEVLDVPILRDVGIVSAMGLGFDEFFNEGMERSNAKAIILDWKGFGLYMVDPKEYTITFQKIYE